MSWKIDPAHTRITFSATHMMIAKVHGEFEDFDGRVEFDPEQPATTRVDVTIQAASINTRNKDRDNHLRSADFFNAEEFPTLSFRSTRVTPIDADRATLTGELTIRGVTKEVSLDVSYSGLMKSPWGMNSAGFSAATTIKRSDWGLTWNVALEAGGVLVSDEISIALEVELIQEAAPETA